MEKVMEERDKGQPANEHIFEIRYKPNPKILDYRGTWAELISKHMGLPDWRILENRVDVFDKETKNRCFVGFRNSGCTTRDAPTANYFPDQAVKFFRYVLSLDGFGKAPFVERIGVRIRFLTPHTSTFDDLLNRYANRYLKMTEAAEKAIRAKLIDIGGPLNFVDKHGNFNTSSGPMIDEQSSELFPWKENLPKVGLYYDIDYWQKPMQEVSDVEILKIISTFAKEAWERHERVKQLIMGE